MTKTFTSNNNLKINITLKDGTEYLGRDIPPKPFGEHERVVSFWDADGRAIIIIPMSEVKSIALYEELYKDTEKN